jgi:hypothetical protein
MKEEISELVKESLSEDEIEDEVSVEAMEGQGIEKGVKHETKEQDELDIEDDMELDDDMEIEDESDEDEDDIEIDSDEMLMMDLPGDELEVDDEEEILLPLDLTGASDEEILKVFKAMGEEDGIVVTQDGDEITLRDDEADVEYQIQMEEFGGKKGDDSKSHKDYEESNEEFGGKKGDDSKSHKDYEESNEGDEVVYEIEIGEDDGNYYGDSAEDDYSQIEKLKKDAHYDAEKHHKEESYEEYGGKKGDDSKSHKDYEESNEEFGGKKGDDSKSHKDYEESNEEYGGKKGDDSKSHKDYEESNEGDEVVYEIELGEDDGNYYGDAAEDDYSQIEKLKKDAHHDAEEHHKEEHYEEYGGKKGDDSKSHKDYEESNEEFGGKKGDDSKSHKDYEEANEIRSHAAGQKASSDKSKGLKRPHSIPNRARYNESALEKEVKQLREKNEEYRKALNIFKEKLNEVAVFNSNLAYATRLFTEHSTTKQEKINILRRFDSAETIKESKSLYKTVKEDLDSKGSSSVVTESVASKVQKSPSKGSATNLIESKTYENPQFMRMKDLMGKLQK